jgi:hypothetical protein
VFDIAELKWDKLLWIHATTHSGGSLAGFGLALVLSDGSATDAVEIWSQGGFLGRMRRKNYQWRIPRGHPTRELALVSGGEQTTEVLRRLVECFGYKPVPHPALPDKTAVLGEPLILRGTIVPDQGRFVAQMKVAFPEQNSLPYAEFFLGINSVRKQLWVSEKNSDYRTAILNRITDFSGAT